MDDRDRTHVVDIPCLVCSARVGYEWDARHRSYRYFHPGYDVFTIPERVIRDQPLEAFDAVVENLVALHYPNGRP